MTATNEIETLKAELETAKREVMARDAIARHHEKGHAPIAQSFHRFIIDDIIKTIPHDAPDSADYLISKIVHEMPAVVTQKSETKTPAYNPADMGGTAKQRKAAIAKRFGLAG